MMYEDEFKKLLTLCKELREYIDLKNTVDGSAIAFRFRSDDDNEFYRKVTREEFLNNDKSFGIALTRWAGFVDTYEVENKVERQAGASVKSEDKIG